MNTAAAQKKQTAFRLDGDLLERLRVKARRENRSLNNYVERVLMAVAYDEPNEITIAAMKEAMTTGSRNRR
ncbi:MAG: toxin-antitoxin system HicB family antitoxin [Bacteroidaceae bacterium]|nr:toxin-antitoxin system HicB family antitoxin [Bacteroidaceae bacterium]